MHPVPLDEENFQIIDEQTLAKYNKFRICFKAIGTVMTTILFVIGIFVPWITEIIVASQLTLEQNITTVLVCGILQTIFAILGSLRLGNSIYLCCSIESNKNQNAEREDDESFKERAATVWHRFWCGNKKGDCTNFEMIISGGYTIYTLPQWFATNAIISWVIVDHKIPIPFYAHLLIYTPLLSYIIFPFVGYAIGKAINQIKNGKM